MTYVIFNCNLIPLILLGTHKDIPILKKPKPSPWPWWYWWHCWAVSEGHQRGTWNRWPGSWIRDRNYNNNNFVVILSQMRSLNCRLHQGKWCLLLGIMRATSLMPLKFPIRRHKKRIASWKRNLAKRLKSLILIKFRIMTLSESWSSWRILGPLLCQTLS